jgi:protein-S-isoprenylcysteine O-methyltransferase Ste14
MGDTGADPVDHARTTRKHAGETFKNGANAPGLIAVALGVVALVAGLFGVAAGHSTIGILALALAAIAGVAGLAWLAYTHRQVRKAELVWHQTHSNEPASPPAS